MTTLQQLTDRAVAEGKVPGAVALVSRGAELEVAVSGSRDVAGTGAVTRDSVFRIASITKPILAAALMIMVDRGQLALEDDITRWLPELHGVRVLRRPDGPLSDTVPLARPITVRQLADFTAGWGFPERFDWPGVAPLIDRLGQGPPQPQQVPAPDEWVRRLAEVPLMAQPGERWLYNLCADLLGVLLARVADRPLSELLTALIFDPLGMAETGFAFRAAQADRRTSLYRRSADGPAAGLDLVDGPDGQWNSLPEFSSGAGGLVSTVDDWHAFARLLLARGRLGRHRLISEPSITSMIGTDHTTAQQRADAGVFLGGQGWGFGGSIDRDAREPWNVPGRYGWVGGTGTAGYVFPDADTAVVVMGQVELAGPDDHALLGEVLGYAARVARGESRLGSGS